KLVFSIEFSKCLITQLESIGTSAMDNSCTN
ncbi:uncharacterized protein METZ01_LOCUS288860, partial [marine metagenome]